jgi:hypothetical protein
VIALLPTLTLVWGKGKKAGFTAEVENTITKFTIPTALAGGDYYVGAIVDTANKVAESNESNNTGYDATPTSISAL